MAIRIEDARLEELLSACAAALDLRLALEEGALRWVGPEEQREQAMARVVEGIWVARASGLG